MSRYRSINVDVDIDLDDILCDITDKDLEAYGLRKIEPGCQPDDLHADLYQAAEAGNCAAMLRAVEIMAWELNGKILVTRMAA